MATPRPRRDQLVHALRFLAPPPLGGSVPGYSALRRYDRANLRGDLIGGITVGAVAVPSSLAMAELAGLPVQYGLYGTFLPLLIYGILCTSREQVIGPDSTIAALTGVTIVPIAAASGNTSPAHLAVLAAALALIMGAILLVAAMLRMGFVADFFGKPVLLGYINGVAITVIAAQLGKLLGISISARDVPGIVAEVVRDLDQANEATVVLSAALLAIALLVRRFARMVPPALVVLALGLLVPVVIDLADHDIATVGEVQGGLPAVGVPWISLAELRDLLLPAAAFSLIAFADLIGTVRLRAQRKGYDVDANRELFALGGANAIGALTGAFPVSSSNSRSAVNDGAGARSQAAILIAAVVVGVFLVVAMPLLEPLPMDALGVIVVVAALGLINIGSIWKLRHVRPTEVTLAVVAFVGVIVFGVMGGVAVAIALSIAVFLQRAARPHDAVLGKVVDVDGFHDVEQHPDAETLPGLVVYRFDAPVFFVNAEYLHLRVRSVVERHPGVEWLVLNAEAWVYLDATGIDALTTIHDELAAKGIVLGFARLKSRQREIFAETGLLDRVGADHVFPTVGSAVAAFEARAAEPVAPSS